MDVCSWVPSLVRKIPWRREWQSTPVFSPREFCGQRSLAGYSPWGHRESDMTEQLTQVSKSFAISPPLDCLFSDYWILRALLALNISPLSKRFFSVSGLSSSPNRLLRSNIFNFGEMHLKVFIVYIVLLVSYVRNLCLI